MARVGPSVRAFRGSRLNFTHKIRPLGARGTRVVCQHVQPGPAAHFGTYLVVTGSSRRAPRDVSGHRRVARRVRGRRACAPPALLPCRPLDSPEGHGATEAYGLALTLLNHYYYFLLIYNRHALSIKFSLSPCCLRNFAYSALCSHSYRH